MRKACLLLIFLIVSMGIVFPPSFFAATEQKKKTRRPAPPITSTRTDTSARLALVIGNSAYQFSPLKNPVNDASDMAAALKGLGFDVILKTDADLETMEENLEKFGNRLKKGGVGLFFYAGHGLQMAGTNYLIPIHARVNKESRVKYEALDVGKILDEMANANNGLNIVILDACRDNPFARQFRSASHGLAGITNAPLGTFIAYSTSPGKVADEGEGRRNSPYTSALLEMIKEPGMPIEEVFKGVRKKIISATEGQQIPWEHTSLQGKFYFNPGTQMAGLSVQEREEKDKFTIDDLEKKAGTEKPVWNTKLKNMKTAFEKAEQFEKKKGAPGLKVEAWQRFLDTYQEKNPYSDEDTRLREKAGERINHWQNEKKALEEAWAKLEAKKKEAEEKKKQAEEEKRLEAERLKEEKKQKQIEAKQKQEEERQRLEEEKQQKEGMKAKQGDKAVWDAELKKMKAAFKKVEEYEKKKVDLDLKIEAWIGFLDTYDMKNPYTDEDRQIRAKAGERISHWQNEKNALFAEKGKLEAKRKEAEEKGKQAEEEKRQEEARKRIEAQRLEEERVRLEAEKKRVEEEKKVLSKQTPETPKDFKDSVTGMEFVLIPPGSFTMGSPADETGRWDKDEREGPTHRVEITRAFYLGKHEVTVGQFRKFVQDSGYKTDAETGGGAYTLVEGKWGKKEGTYWDNPGFSLTDNHPVTCVSWNDAQAFIRWLNRKSSRTYRLPTEAEWEYAARAGTTTSRFWGDDPDQACKYANVSDQTIDHVNKKKWNSPRHECEDGYFFTAPVGNYSPNAFGLYDMLGNVWEWCEDWFDKDYYKNSPNRNPTGPPSGQYRVVRGGAWSDLPRFVRAAYRDDGSPGVRHFYLGFRLAGPR